VKLGVPREVHPGERRVAATPETVGKLGRLGFDVYVERGAGAGAGFGDEAYEVAGAVLVDGCDPIWSGCDVVIKVRAPEDLADGGSEVDRLRVGGVLVCLLHPASNGPLVERLATREATVLALDQVPRISRAQKMDVLSSMANIAGYRAIIEAANLYGSFFAGQITAAGRTRPAQVLVIGAGVAGLAAVAAARGLGAEVYAFDVRPAVKEQVESLGARFLEVEMPPDEGGETAGGYAKTMSPEFIAAEMRLFAEWAGKCDVVITTALIPGKRAPILITTEMVRGMKAGSVVVDLAAEQGGNCEATVPHQAVEVEGVHIVGYTDLTSRLATQASQLFGTNLFHLLSDMGGAANWKIDLDDEVVRGALILHQGRVTWPPPVVPPPPPKPVAPSAPAAVAKAAPLVSAAPAAPARSKSSAKHGHQAKSSTSKGSADIVLLVAGVAAIGVGLVAPDSFVQHLTVFILACFIGWQVVWNVAPALHTPLMSVTNAISGIILVGGILTAGRGELDLAAGLGAVAILVATINIAGGFLVTHRMLQMFRK
jgi:H+-translocating NAD(P) transhydrogenase subunit alpha